MDIKVEKKEDSKVILTFTMSKEDFGEELEKAYRKNAKRFNVQGFRKGMAPMNVVEEVYGPQALYEFVIEDTVDDAYRTAVIENNLDVVSRPTLDIKQIGKGKDFIYTVELYVKPEAKVKEYKGLEVKKVSTRVTKKDVDAELDRVREQNARVVTVEDRELKDGDISVIDFEGFIDGKAFEGGKAENFELTIGSHQFIPGFEEQMIGMKSGEEKDINVKFPEDYHVAELAGKDSTFKVKLHEIKEKILPEIDDEFAKDVSEFDTLEEYKKDLNKKIKERKEHEAKHEVEDEVMHKFVENVEVKIPDAMVESEIDKMIDEMNANLSYQGLTIDQYLQYIGMSMQDYRENMKDSAVERIKLDLGLEIVEKEEKIEVTDEEIDERIKELAKQYGQQEGNADSLLKNENARNYMKEQIAHEKTLKVITDSAIQK